MHPSTKLRTSSHRSGYVALVTALLILITILIVVSTVGITSFFGRQNTQSAYYKEISRSLAEGCVETARLKLVISSSYAGNETVAIGSSSCRIVSVVASGTSKVIRSEAFYQDAATNLRVAIASGTLVSWEELTDF